MQCRWEVSGESQADHHRWFSEAQEADEMFRCQFLLGKRETFLFFLARFEAMIIEAVVYFKVIYMFSNIMDVE